MGRRRCVRFLPLVVSDQADRTERFTVEVKRFVYAGGFIIHNLGRAASHGRAFARPAPSKGSSGVDCSPCGGPAQADAPRAIWGSALYGPTSSMVDASQVESVLGVWGG
ncbi:MAG: hypothetical protein IPK82_09795 [Polyangiaceae bacterium]|nr:hypothetical protein [Polyangiaceae bacterium]